MEEEIFAFAVIAGLGVVSLFLLLYLDATARNRGVTANEKGEAPGRNTTQ
jgi:hypothetical protein